MIRYWVAWRAALWIGDREAQPEGSTRPPLTTAVWLLAPATLTLEIAD